MEENEDKKRLELELSTLEWDLLQKAAKLSNLSLVDFVRNAAIHQSGHLIEEHWRTLEDLPIQNPRGLPHGRDEEVDWL